MSLDAKQYQHIAIKFKDQTPESGVYFIDNTFDRWSNDFEVYLDGMPATITVKLKEENV